jgi:hypothetical protein
MGFVRGKPKVSIEQFCQQFYDSEIFAPSAAGNDTSAIFFDVIASLAKAHASLPEPTQDLLLRETRALRMELFGLAWTHDLPSNLGKRFSYSEMEYLSAEEESLILWEINHTRTYLLENNHYDIWDCMGTYNNCFAVTSSTASSSDVADVAYARSLDGLLEEWEIRVGLECATRLVNRLRIRTYSEKSALSKPLATKLAIRLCWDVDSDSKNFETLESLVLMLYHDAKDRLESVTLLTETQLRFNQPLALWTNRILHILVGLVGFPIVPVSFISVLVITMVDLLTFGLALSILNLIWVFLFFGPLLALSWLWQVTPLFRYLIAFVGVPLALLAYCYVCLVGSLMPWGKFGSKAAELALCEIWPLTGDFLGFMMGKVRRGSDRFTNLAPFLSQVRRANPVLVSYLADTELHPIPPSWFVRYVIPDLIGVAGATIAFCFLWKIHLILPFIAVIPVYFLLITLFRSSVIKETKAYRPFQRLRRLK